MTHGRLVLGDLDLDGTGFSVYALGTDSGTDWGNPAPREVELRSFLADGAVVVTEGYGNRELMVAVEVSDVTSQTAADAEAALMAELGKRNTLTAYPADEIASPAVFEVITSSLTFVPDDLREVMQGDYQYMIRLVCEPWVRAETETVTAAIVPGATTTVIDECSATTAWAASPSGTVATATEADTNTYVVTNSSLVSPALTKTIASTNLSTTPYIRVDWNYVPTIGADKTIIRAYVNGVQMAKVSEEPGATVGYLRTYFDSLGNTAATSLKFEVFTPDGSGRLRISQVARTNALASLGSTRQLLRTLEVGGSARTPGSFELTHGSDALGAAIVYTRPDDGIGYVPALRNSLAASGATTADASLVSGARNDPTTIMMYDRLASMVPAGTHALWVRVRSTTTTNQTFTWTVETVIAGATVGSQSGTTTVDYVGSSTWQLACLGHFRTPVVDMPDPGADTFFRLYIRQTTATGAPTCALDEAWIFDIENGDLSIVDCGTGTDASGQSSNRLWLNSPTVDVPRPTIYVGADSDGNDSRYPGAAAVQAFGTHEFRPGSMLVFTVTPNALAASAQMSHHERYHTLAPA